MAGIPLAKGVWVGYSAVNVVKNNGLNANALADAGTRLTGYNFQTNGFDPMYAIGQFWGPLVIAHLIDTGLQAFAPKLDRTLSKSSGGYIRA